MPKDLAQSIIDRGGLTLNFSTYKLRPHTAITRCQNCQLFHHVAENCKSSTPTCVNCGKAERHEQCTLPPHCVNCTRSNQRLGHSYKTDHKVSNSICPTYRTAFQKERERLDLAFNLRGKLSQSAKQRTPRRTEPLLKNPAPNHYNQTPPSLLGKFEYFNQNLYDMERRRYWHPHQGPPGFVGDCSDDWQGRYPHTNYY